MNDRTTPVLEARYLSLVRILHVQGTEAHCAPLHVALLIDHPLPSLRMHMLNALCPSLETQ